jgi:hypothetical protein
LNPHGHKAIRPPQPVGARCIACRRVSPSVVPCLDAADLVVLVTSRCTGFTNSWGNPWGNGRDCRGALLHHADPLLVVEPEVAVGNHRAGLCELVLSAKDQLGGASGASHLAGGRPRFLYGIRRPDPIPILNRTASRSRYGSASVWNRPRESDRR